MATNVEVEKLALDLPEAQRAILAARLLRSLPAILQERDDGVAEALSRDSDFEANPSLGLSQEELDDRIGQEPVRQAQGGLSSVQFKKFNHEQNI